MTDHKKADVMGTRLMDRIGQVRDTPLMFEEVQKICRRMGTGAGEVACVLECELYDVPADYCLAVCEVCGVSVSKLLGDD